MEISRCLESIDDIVCEITDAIGPNRPAHKYSEIRVRPRIRVINDVQFFSAPVKWGKNRGTSGSAIIAMARDSQGARSDATTTINCRAKSIDRTVKIALGSGRKINQRNGARISAPSTRKRPYLLFHPNNAALIAPVIPQSMTRTMYISRMVIAPT